MDEVFEWRGKRGASAGRMERVDEQGREKVGGRIGVGEGGGG